MNKTILATIAAAAQLAGARFLADESAESCWIKVEPRSGFGDLPLAGPFNYDLILGKCYERCPLWYVRKDATTCQKCEFKCGGWLGLQCAW